MRDELNRREVVGAMMSMGFFFARRRRADAAASAPGESPPTPPQVRVPVAASDRASATATIAGAPAGAGEDSYRRGRAARTSSERRSAFREGMDRAQARLVAQPDDPAALFWLAVNTGAEALERGKLQALPALPQMERLLLRCHQIAPGYEHAGPARVLGRLYHKAPSLISIGSTTKARQWLETALATAPDFPGNLAFAADFLSVEGEPERAMGLARRCLDLLSARDYGPDGTEWRTVAIDVLEARR